MRTTTYTCDRCSLSITVGRTVLTVEAGSTPPSWPTRTESGRPTLDLCHECMDDLNTWIVSPIVKHEGGGS